MRIGSIRNFRHLYFHHFWSHGTSLRDSIDSHAYRARPVDARSMKGFRLRRFAHEPFPPYARTVMSDLEKHDDRPLNVDVYHEEVDSFSNHRGGELQRKLKTRHIAMIRQVSPTLNPLERFLTTTRFQYWRCYRYWPFPWYCRRPAEWRPNRPLTWLFDYGNDFLLHHGLFG